MGRTPCCSKVGLNRGPWTPVEDDLLTEYIQKHGEGGWRTLPRKAGLLRCGKSCRLRWMNYLRPDVKRGQILPDEEDLILRLHRLLGNRWSLIAGRIPGRTDNEIKNYWNTHLSRKLISQGIDPRTHKPLAESELDNHSPNEGNNKVDSENELNPSSDSQYKYPETATVDDNSETTEVVEDTELPETPVAGSLRDFIDINASNTITALSGIFHGRRSITGGSQQACWIFRKQTAVLAY
uniref:Uncharacterized protein n=1 Tax=Araucaria cunninghamii TaxID=56994 RepID=A0A0D6QSU8_ARACU